LGFILAPGILSSSIPNLANNSIMRIIIGLLCNQITLITPFTVFSLSPVKFSSLFYMSDSG
jgi:hypothetical protein